MGLHQKIIDRTESEPCDCPADDDHVVPLADNPELIQQLFDEHADDAWTDGTEADE